ncbi:MAG: hypothetical protein IKH88_10770 [Prevotella sp.]|nr:hypothetical protein [Prevotella sp.]
MNIIIVLCAVAVVLIAATIAYVCHLRAEARKCAIEARQFHVRLKVLTAPNHLFTDKELASLKEEMAPLLFRVNKLYKNYFISNDYLDRMGLGDFIEERMHLNHAQYLNNKQYH